MPIARTLPELLSTYAQEQPDSTCFRYLRNGATVQSVTTGDLHRRARAVASFLQSHTGSRDRVLILANPGLDYIVGLFGCLYANRVAVPVSPPRAGRALERLNTLIHKAKSHLALAAQLPSQAVREQVAKELGPHAVEWHAIATTESSFDPDAFVATDVRPEDIAFLQYTSGSTNDPKGVMLSHTAVIANLEALIQRGQLSERDHIVSWLPAYHDMGLLSGVFMPLRLRACASLMSPSDFIQRPFNWLQAISRQGATIAGASNFGFELCLRRISAEEREQLDLRTWRIAFCGAERVQPETLDRFTQEFGRYGLDAKAFCPCYGLAESTAGVTFKSPSELPHSRCFDTAQLLAGQAVVTSLAGTRLVGLGQILNGHAITIRDPDSLTPLAEGRVGEIWVQGPSLATGYFDSPQRSAEVFLTETHGNGVWLRSGDLGFLLEGQLYVTGRRKDLIICRGANYYPEDIEHTVAASDNRLILGTSAAFSIETPGEEALVILQEVDSSIDALAVLASTIRTLVAESHALQVYDLVFVRTGTLPRTSSGKIQRGRCREAYLASNLRVVSADEGRTSVSRRPEREIAREISRIMAELLEIRELDEASNFFELGANSLLATQLVSRARAQLGVDIPIRTVFESPTPNGIAAHIARWGTAQPAIAQSEVDAAARLSFSQERMWLLHQFQSKSAAYNVAGGVNIEGELVPAVLEQALNRLIARHDALRSNYPNVDGAPSIVVHDTLFVSLQPIDVTTSTDPMSEAQARAGALAQKPFAVGTEPLIRAALYRISAEKHLFAISMHHLVSDAWSIGVFASQLGQIYTALLHNRQAPEVPTISWFRYAATERQLVSEARVADGVAFFRKLLDGSRTLEFPLDHARASTGTSGGALETFEVGAELWNGIRAFAKSLSVTPFIVLLSAFAIVLKKWTGQDDLVIGVPTANRNVLESEHLIGTLVNTLPVRIQLDDATTAETLVSRVARTFWDVYSHQDVPFEYLVRELQIERVAGQVPLIQVMFDYQNTRLDMSSFENLNIAPCVLDRKATQFDLSLFIGDNAFSQSCSIEYATELFESATIRALCEHFRNVLQTMLLEPGIDLERLDVLGDEERQSILQLSRRACRFPKSTLRVTERLSKWAKDSPNAEAVRDDSGSYTYAELWKRANAIGSELQALGVQSGDRVIVSLERSKDVLAALLAVMLVGGVYIPLDPRYPQDRVLYIAGDCQPRAAVTTSELALSVFSGADAKLLLLDQFVDSTAQTEQVTVSPEQPAYIIYTSGSTGRPKGVSIPVSALGNFLESMLDCPGLTAHDRWLSVTTISFDIAALELFLPIVAGACVYIASLATTVDGQLLAKKIAEFSATVMQATPATWRLLMDSGWQGHVGLKVLCGGEAMPPDLATGLLQRCQSLFNMYGPTETTIWSTVYQVLQPQKPIPIGTPIRNTAVYVLDEHLSLVGNGVPGELWIGGDGLALGYFERPALTSERFLPDPFDTSRQGRMYRTGDRGRRRWDGELECFGRVDHQVKIRGYRIEPEEIEAVLKQHNSLKEVVVVPYEAGPGDVRLVAYVVPESNVFDANAALRALHGTLPDYMVPSACVVLTSLPRTPNGKLDRASLPKPTAGASNDHARGALPNGELETRLASIWSELLDQSPIYLQDSFFALGGHSLLAVRLVAKIKREWGLELQIVELLQNPTLERLAAVVRSKMDRALPASQEKWQFLVPVASGPDRPLFCIHGGGGGVKTFFDLVERFRGKHTVVALQARGVDGRQVPHDSMRTMVDDYLKELRAYAPHGPYRLLGYCAGGVVAYAMAQRLASEGAEVELLGMIDAYHPHVQVRRSRWKSWSSTFKSGGLRGVIARGLNSVRFRLKLASQILGVWFARVTGRVVPIELREFQLMRTLGKLECEFDFGEYPGRLILLRAEDALPELAIAAPELGWSRYVKGGLEVIDCPGTHQSLVLEPNVAHLAEKIERFLSSG